MKCPRCGSEIPKRVIVDLGLNILSCPGGIIKLTPFEAEVVYTLVTKMPHVANLDYIISSVWGQTEPDTAKRSLNVTIHKLRKKLKPLGLKITTSRCQGYLFHENRD